MDLEKLKAENQHLKKTLEQSTGMLQIRMNRIFQLVDELEGANTRCGSLQDVIDEASTLIKEALNLDSVDEIFGKLREIKDILEG